MPAIVPGAWSQLFDPQQVAVPSVRMPQEWLAPVVMSVQVPVRSPGAWPEPFDPQQVAVRKSLPAGRIAACCG